VFAFGQHVPLQQKLLFGSHWPPQHCGPPGVFRHVLDLGQHVEPQQTLVAGSQQF
jgi:hypothetical protein